MKKKQPLYISVKGKSKIIDEETMILKDGRTVKIQYWREANRSFVTYFFSITDLEDKTKEDLYMYLLEQGISLRTPFSKGIVTIQKFYNEEKQLCWGLTMIVNSIPEK